MAGRLILVKIPGIDGDSLVPSYANQLEFNSLTFGATTTLTDGDETAKKTGSIDSSHVTGSLRLGGWIAEMQAALYGSKVFDTIEITELEYEGNANARTYKKVRMLTLTKAYFTTVDHSWNGIGCTNEVAIQFVNMIYAWGEKVAEHSNNEGAKAN